MLHLTRIYWAALQLTTSVGADEDAPCVCVDDAAWKKVFAHAARLPFDLYGEVFDPVKVPAEQPITASLADDIADIYRDVVNGLNDYEAGRREAALWRWTLTFQSHWGEHITGAIRALHCWLAAHDPSRLSADAKLTNTITSPPARESYSRSRNSPATRPPRSGAS